MSAESVEGAKHSLVVAVSRKSHRQPHPKAPHTVKWERDELVPKSEPGTLDPKPCTIQRVECVT